MLVRLERVLHLPFSGIIPSESHLCWLRCPLSECFPGLSVYGPKSSNFFNVAQTVGTSRHRLINNILGRMEQIFQQLEPFIAVPPPQSMKGKTQEILLVALSVLTSVTENITQGRTSKFILGRYIVIYSLLIREIFNKAAREGCR